LNDMAEAQGNCTPFWQEPGVTQGPNPQEYQPHVQEDQDLADQKSPLEDTLVALVVPDLDLHFYYPFHPANSPKSSSMGACTRMSVLANSPLDLSTAQVTQS
jgi:hypothetical protein